MLGRDQGVLERDHRNAKKRSGKGSRGAGKGVNSIEKKYSKPLIVYSAQCTSSINRHNNGKKRSGTILVNK
jgi:hypothetical protein